MSDTSVRISDKYDYKKWPIHFALPENIADIRITDSCIVDQGHGTYLSCTWLMTLPLKPEALGGLEISVAAQHSSILLLAEASQESPYFKADEALIRIGRNILIPDDAIPTTSSPPVELVARKIEIGAEGCSAELTGMWILPDNNPATAPIRLEAWPEGPLLALTSASGRVVHNRIASLSGTACLQLPLLPKSALLDCNWDVELDGGRVDQWKSSVNLREKTQIDLLDLGCLVIDKLYGQIIQRIKKFDLTANISGEFLKLGVNLEDAHCVIQSGPHHVRLELQIGTFQLASLPEPLNSLLLENAKLIVDGNPDPAGKFQLVEIEGHCTWGLVSSWVALPNDVPPPQGATDIVLNLHWEQNKTGFMKLTLQCPLGNLFEGLDPAWRPRDVTGKLQFSGQLAPGGRSAQLQRVEGLASIECLAPLVLAQNQGIGLACEQPDAVQTGQLRFAPRSFSLDVIAGKGEDTNARTGLLFRLPGLGNAALQSATLDVNSSRWSLEANGDFDLDAVLSALLHREAGKFLCWLSASGPVNGEQADLDEVSGSIEGAFAIDLPSLQQGISPVRLCTLRRLALSVRQGSATDPGFLKLSGSATLLENLSVGELLDGLNSGPMRPLLAPLFSPLFGAGLVVDIDVATKPASDGSRPWKVCITATAAPATQPFNLLEALSALVTGSRPTKTLGITIGDKSIALDELFELQLKKVVFTCAAQELEAALTLTLNVMGQKMDVTATLGTKAGKPFVSLLLGDTNHGGDPIVLRIPGPGAGSWQDIADKVSRDLQIDSGVVRQLAQALDQFLSGDQSFSTLELSDIGIDCSPDELGKVIPKITGTVQVLELPGALAPMMPAGVTLTLSSSVDGIRIGMGAGNSAKPLLHLPLEGLATAERAPRAIDLYLQGLSLGYSWAENTISVGCDARLDTTSADLLSVQTADGTGVKVQTPLIVELQTELTVTPPPVPLPQWKFRFDSGAVNAVEQLGAQFFINDKDGSQFARVWFRESSFNPMGWLLCPTLVGDGGIVIGGPSPSRTHTQAGKTTPLYPTADAWISALTEGQTTDVFHLHASATQLTTILISPTVALLMNPLVFAPMAPPMPPFWIGSYPLGPLVDFYFENLSASINIPGFLHLGLKLSRPLPRFDAETLLALGALMASGFQAEISADSALHQIFYASARLDIHSPLLAGPSSGGQTVIVEVDLVQALEAVGDAISAVQDLAKTTSDLVASVPALWQKLQQSPNLAVRMIPRESRQFTLQMNVGLLGMKVSASLILLSPEECMDELVLFHESKRRRRVQAPLQRNRPVLQPKPEIAQAWQPPSTVTLQRQRLRALDDPEAETPTPYAHARAQRLEWAAQLADQICLTRWNQGAQRRSLLAEWMADNQAAALEKLLDAEFKKSVPAGPVIPVINVLGNSPLPTAVIEPNPRTSRRYRTAVMRWALQSNVIRHPYLEARIQWRNQFLMVPPITIASGLRPVLNTTLVKPALAAKPVLATAAIAPVSTINIAAIRLNLRQTQIQQLHASITATLTPALQQRLAATAFKALSPQAVNRPVQFDLGQRIEKLKKRLQERLDKTQSRSATQVEDRNSPTFALYLQPPGAAETLLRADVPRGRIWSIRHADGRYRLKVLGQPQLLEVLVPDVAVRQAVRLLARPASLRTPAEVISVLRRWIQPRYPMVDAATRGAAAPGAANFSQNWESSPTLYQQSVFCRDEYRITDSNRYGDVIGRRGGVCFADLLHTMEGDRHRYFKADGPVLMAGFDASLWGQNVHFAGLVAPAANAPAFFMVARSELDVDLPGVDLHLEGDLTLLSGSVWNDLADASSVDGLSFNGSIDCSIGDFNFDLQATGQLTPHAGRIDFDLQGNTSLALRIPLINVSLWPVEYHYRLKLDATLDGKLVCTRDELTFLAKLNQLNFTLEEWKLQSNGRMGWSYAASVNVSGQVSYQKTTGLILEGSFLVPTILQGPAQFMAELNADDAISYNSINKKMDILFELD